MSGLVKFERIARRAGGTLAVTIPPEVQQAVGMEEGSRLEITVTEKGEVLLKVKPRG